MAEGIAARTGIAAGDAVRPAVLAPGRAKAVARLREGKWLTDTQVRSLAQCPGKYRIGPHVWLIVRRPGVGTHEFRFMVGGKAQTLGLGGYPAV
ncbi:MAG TPA: Arm DNA-binding domain-containing protein, partial [Acetobacteraceae bacterium]|nr:Arm DNA-binding domain-containing protein [Acetobacteraceae bacterium]